MTNPLNSITGTLVLGLILVVVSIVYALLLKQLGGVVLLVVTLAVGVIYWIIQALIINRQ